MKGKRNINEICSNAKESTIIDFNVGPLFQHSSVAYLWSAYLSRASRVIQGFLQDPCAGDWSQMVHVVGNTTKNTPSCLMLETCWLQNSELR